MAASGSEGLACPTDKKCNVRIPGDPYNENKGAWGFDSVHQALLCQRLLQVLGTTEMTSLPPKEFTVLLWKQIWLSHDLWFIGESQFTGV